ncbi:MAG: cytochrome-c peroxidase [Deltaproteobacteria bacterium]
MKFYKLPFFFFLFIYCIFSCRNTKPADNQITVDLDQTIHNLTKSYISQLPELNLETMSEEQKRIIELGKSLFYEKKLSGSQTISCASCHDISKYGVDNKALSPGDKNQTGIRNSQTVFNTYLYGDQNWDTKFKSVEDQVMGPIFSELEMAMPDTKTLLSRLKNDKFYTTAFAEAFPANKPHISLENIKKALGSFERTLITPSRFDEYLKGNLKALTQEEKLGAYSFVINCKSCHSSALVGGGFAVEYPIFGYHSDYSDNNNLDLGKYNVTKNPDDKHVFKVPQLRNIEKTYPYMHDGSVKTLEDAIRICSMAESNIRLNEKDVLLISAFLRTMTGKIPEHALPNRKIFN